MIRSVLVHPLGVPVEIASRAPAVLEAAVEAWGSWRALFAVEPLRVLVDAAPGERSGEPRFTARGGWFAFRSGPDNYSVFSTAARCIRMRITEATLEDRTWFRYHFLESAVLTALDTLIFTPIHAACVDRDGQGILLCGDSGAGKSSLAYGCARAGWTFVSDDALHAVNADATRVIGNPDRMHLRPAACDLFPELAGRPVQTVPNGKSAVIIHPQAEGLSSRAESRIVTCVFLRRSRTGVAVWHDFPRAAALAYFARYVTWGDAALQRRIYESLLAGGTRVLEYDGVDAAVAALDQVSQEFKA